MQTAGTTNVDASTASTIARAADRRRFSWRTVVHGFLRSRRHTVRRADDGEALFSDWHDPWLFFLSVAIMLLSCSDAYLTLQLLDRGAYEANPVMLAAMRVDIQTFAWAKMVLTALGVLTLVFLSRATFLSLFRTRHVLTVVFVMYASLVCYEFVTLLGTS